MKLHMLKLPTLPTRSSSYTTPDTTHTDCLGQSTHDHRQDRFVLLSNRASDNAAAALPWALSTAFILQFYLNLNLVKIAAEQQA